MNSAKILVSFRGQKMIFNLIHNSSETTGLIGDALKALRLPHKDVHVYNGEGFPRDTSDLSGLVLMGGPMSVNDVTEYPFLLPELQLIEKVLAEGKPILGVCLGSQLIAKALGSDVYVHNRREVGWHPIDLTVEGKNDVHLKNIPTQTPVFHWHGETFDLPQGATLLATSEKCKNQAFKWGENTYALQFHLEVTSVMVKDWCSTQSGQDYAKSAGEEASDILHKTKPCFGALKPLANNFLQSYLSAAFSKIASLA